MNTIWNDIKNNYNSGTNFTKILYINIGFFLIYKILFVFSFLFETEGITYFTENYLSLPSNKSLVFKKPWTLISYMFVHLDFFHILFNMIWLHFGSKLFLQYFNGKQLVSTYILGGISGGMLYIIAFNLFPAFQDQVDTSVVIGASASVLAIFIAIATYQPNYTVSFPFIGRVELKQIAIVLIVLDLLSISPDNPGGHISHLGGALFGYLYISLLKRGTDISVNFYKFIGSFSLKNKSKLRKVHKRNKKKNDDDFRNNKSEKQKKINSILEKISKSGYDSLSKSEKEILFKESK